MKLAQAIQAIRDIRRRVTYSLPHLCSFVTVQEGDDITQGPDRLQECMHLLQQRAELRTQVVATLAQRPDIVRALATLEVAQLRAQLYPSVHKVGSPQEERLWQLKRANFLKRLRKQPKPREPEPWERLKVRSLRYTAPLEFAEVLTKIHEQIDRQQTEARLNLARLSNTTELERR